MATSPLPVCVNDFEEHARQNLPTRTFDFYADGAAEKQTLIDNIEAFRRLRLRPRLMRDVSNRDMSTTILGERIQFPIAIAPTALHCLAHSDGEIATAKAAASIETGMILSTCSTISMEDVSNFAPGGLRWFQLSILRDNELVTSFVKRAERAGYRALFVTLDQPDVGKKYAVLRNNFEIPASYRHGNFIGTKYEGRDGYKDFSSILNNTTATWKTIDWLRSITKLPIVAKGILTAEDAREAIKHGVSGILVSNHGGRQLDGVLATIDALPEVVQAVKGSGVEVYMDGGVRTGTDVLKALALGARAVFVGRPVLWGLAYDGENGVKRVLEILRDEFSLAMALAGCRSLGEIDSDLVERRSVYVSKL